jgi:hypothetical protein
VTTVGASPETLDRLADMLDAGADAIDVRNRALSAALDLFLAQRPEYRPEVTFDRRGLSDESAAARSLAADIARLSLALRLADAEDVNLALRRPQGLIGDFVIVDTGSLQRFLQIDPAATFSHRIAQLERQLDVLRADPPPEGRARTAGRHRWRAEIAALENEVAQYRALVRAPYERWGGAGTEVWASYTSFSSDVASATREANELGPAPVESTNARSAVIKARASAERFRSEHPFVAAALDSSVIITPGRLDVLKELDALVGEPMDDFLEARAAAATETPSYDWTADGCSGPIPSQAASACLRHDFIYRNGRMLRDQWGLSQAFAEHVKATADNYFGRELWDSFSWHERDAVIIGWVWAAEAAVSSFGSVAGIWNPPREGGFWGDTPPP